MQVLVNESEEVLGFNNRLLIGATELSVNRIVELIHIFNGLAVASHIDREGFGIVGQLGFIPEGIEFDALEISYRTSRKRRRRCSALTAISHGSLPLMRTDSKT